MHAGTEILIYFCTLFGLKERKYMNFKCDFGYKKSANLIALRAMYRLNEQLRLQKASCDS